MTDKDFDEIMQQYVDSTRGDKEKDLSKLRSAQNNCNERTNKAPKNKKPIWLTIAAAVTVVVVLCITLPLTLINDDPTNNLYLITNDDINNIDGALIEQLDNIDQVLLPQIVDVNVTTSMWQLKDNNSFIGMEQILDVFNENIDSISLVLLRKEYQYNILNQYENLQNTIEWRNKLIKYNYIDDINGILYNTYIIFEMDIYKYYINVKSYEKLPIQNILDFIY